MHEHWPRLALIFWLCGLTATVSAQTPVTLVRPTTGDSVETLRFTGNLTARRTARLSPQEAGLISAMHIDAGDNVGEGDTLVELDARLVELDVAGAQAAREEAAAALEEARRLADEGRRLGNDRFIPETELRARESAVLLAEAALARADSELARERERLKRHRLRAPFDGVITQRHADRGEWVDPGTAVADLVKIDELWLDVRVPQRYWSDLAGDNGAGVRAWADVAPDRELDAHVHARVPVSDATARTFLLRLLINDDSGDITPGMSARVELTLERDQPGVRLPRDAVVRYPDGTTTVWIVEDGSHQAHEHEVAIRRNVGDQVEIDSALPERARVVVRGNEVLSEGETVLVTEDGD